MLQRGDQVPHFSVKRPDGSEVCYAADVWQQRNLLLVVLPDRSGNGFAEYAAGLAERRADMAAAETTLVVTTEEVPGAPRPGVLIADRWGEIQLAAQATRPRDLPQADELLEWLRYVQYKCPECEGEAR